MQLTTEEFDEVCGAVQEYGRLEYRAGLGTGTVARAALREAHAALTDLQATLGRHVAPSVPRPGAGEDHRAAAREHVLANHDLHGDPDEPTEPADLARQCLAWIASYRTDLDPVTYRDCVLGVLDAYRQLGATANPWTSAVPRPR